MNCVNGQRSITSSKKVLKGEEDGHFKRINGQDFK